MPKLRNPNGPYWKALEAAERKLILETLAVTKGDMKNAARLLCISRNFLRIRCNQLEIDIDQVRAQVGSSRLSRKMHSTAPPSGLGDAEASWLLGTLDEPEDA